MRKPCAATALLLVFLLSTMHLSAGTYASPSAPTVQVPDASQSEPASPQAQFPEDKSPKSEAQLKAEKLQEKERQKQRWQDIKRRSEQLLEVATELKQYVDKSGENVMSLEVIKKAEQMEKLSKELQKKMKGD